ncbi:MAG: putative transposase YdaD [Planctomycetota bacterium]|jgi:predicted transposase YdaD
MAPQPHDNQIRSVFSKPRHAAAMLQTFLPEEVITYLDFQSKKLCRGTFVDEKLRRHETDLLFSIKREARESYI